MVLHLNKNNKMLHTHSNNTLLFVAAIIVCTLLFGFVSSSNVIAALNITFNNGSILVLEEKYFFASFTNVQQKGRYPGKQDWYMSLVTPSLFNGACLQRLFLVSGGVLCNNDLFPYAARSATPIEGDAGSGIQLVFNGGGYLKVATLDILCDPSHETLFSPTNSYTASRPVDITFFNWTLKSKGACLPTCAYALDEADCDSLGSNCTWCSEWNLCVTSSPSLNPSVPSSFGVCQCGTYSKSQCETMSSVCQWNSKVLVGAEDAQDYCSANIQCASPTTCEGQNLAPTAQLQSSCEAAGCTFAPGGVCSSGTCFNFFLPSFVSQPFVLLFLGFAKDFVVLLLIGAIGDCLARRIQRFTIRIKMWWKNWSEEQMEIRLLDTVYLIDDECYDGYAMNFEQYCDRLCDQLFDMHLVDEYQNRQAVCDAVSFGLFDSGLWVDLDDKGEQLNSHFTPREYERNLIAPGSSKYTAKKITLEASVVSSRIKLQEIVTKTIEQRASAIIFYAHSRDCKTRMASSLNSFPSDLQLLMYCFGIASMFFSAMYTVVFKNRDTVERIASASCEKGSFNTTNSSLFLNQTSDFNDNAALAEATYFLLGFRLMNASTFGTAMLVFVKVVRAMYQRLSGKLPSLTISQRLPLISLYSNGKIHLLLLFYAALVFPFCWTGLFYGWKYSFECILPPIIGAVLFFVDVAVLNSAGQRVAPRKFWMALLVFLLSEEIPTIIITIALQTSFNYLSLLKYQDAFGIDSHNVIQKDFDSREVECILQMLEKDVSGVISVLTSVVAFW